MIDILLPFYGDGDLARTAIESVLAQTSPDWRLVVVDDQSPDQSVGHWLRALDHPQVQYHRNQRNLGVNGNFKRCLGLATATHVVFLGCDDRLLSNYVEVMTGAIERHPRAGMCQPRVDVIDAAGKRVHTVTDSAKRLLMPRGGERVLAGQSLATSLLHGAWTYFPAICWRRASLVGHDFVAGFETVLDLALILDLVVAGEQFILLDHVAFEYRRHSKSASSLSALDAARFEEEARLFAEMRSRFAQVGWPRAARASALHLTSRLHALSLTHRAFAGGDSDAARSLLRHALYS